MSSNTQLADFITKRRDELRLTQKDLSQRLGNLGYKRDAATISNWESGRYPVPMDLLEILARALELASPAQLYELAGVLDQLRGSDLVKLIQHLPQEEIDRIERMIKAMLVR